MWVRNIGLVFIPIRMLKKLLLMNERIKVVAVTASDDALYANRLLQSGALGYVSKGADLNEMIDAIRAVARGELYMSSRVAQQLALKNATLEPGDQSPFEKLSERELQTAMMIAHGKKVRDIAETYNISPKTINSYRYRIFEKLGVQSDVELTL